MNAATMRRVGETARAMLLAFTAVTLGTVQFLQHALPSPDIVWVSSEIVLLTLAFWILLPTFLLTVLDRAIAGFKGEHAVTSYRAVLFAVAAVLVLRELQLYFPPVEALSGATGPAFLLAFVAVAVLVFRAALRSPRKSQQAVLYMSLVAVPLALFTPVQMAPVLEEPPAGHNVEVQSIGSDSEPAFVFVMDELSYDMLLDGDELDAQRYPNLAAFRNDSVWLTDATTNYLHTNFIVPGFIAAAGRLSNEYDVRVYDQYAYVESYGWDQCGVTYTCRGSAHLTETHQLELSGIVSRRAIFQAAPDFAEPLVGRLSGWLDGSLDAPSPAVDHLAMHTFTNRQVETFLSDVDSDSAPGRLHFVHLLLPHEPYVYQPDGGVSGSAEHTNFDHSSDVDAVNERYRLQAEYLDGLIGRFVQRLRDEGLYERSTILLTGDHGIRRQVVNKSDEIGDEGIPVDDDVTRVPFLVKAPGIAPAVLDVDYQHADFEATLRDVLGVSPIPTDGVSAFETDRPARQRLFYVDQDNDRYWKYVRSESTGEWDLVDYVIGPLPEELESLATTVN
jgi:hypothetical protein